MINFSPERFDLSLSDSFLIKFFQELYEIYQKQERGDSIILIVALTLTALSIFFSILAFSRLSEETKRELKRLLKIVTITVLTLVSLALLCKIGLESDFKLFLNSFVCFGIPGLIFILILEKMKKLKVRKEE